MMKNIIFIASGFILVGRLEEQRYWAKSKSIPDWRRTLFFSHVIGRVSLPQHITAEPIGETKTTNRRLRLTSVVLGTTEANFIARAVTPPAAEYKYNEYAILLSASTLPQGCDS
ncbi:hypothetical protein ACJJTC_016447 [Scirpophaga incertulas]